MPVLHVIAAARRGGAERLLWLIGRELQRSGVQVPVLFFEDGPLRAEFEAAGLRCHVLGGSGRFRPALLPRIAATLRAIDPRMVHVHGLRALFHVGPVARAQRRPVAFGAHAVSMVKDVVYGGLGRSYRAFEGRLCRACAAAVVATSERMRDDLAVHSAVPRELIRVIPPCVDLERLPRASAESRAEARRRFAVSGPVISTIGRLVPLKGYAVMLRALVELPDVTLLMAGDGPERERLVALAAALGVDTRVRILGDTSDVAAVCHASDVVVYPSTAGILGLAALEAMACGVPVVASGLPGVTEFIDDGTTGLLTPPGDGAALAHAVATLLADPVRAQTIALAGARVVRVRHSPEAAAAQHLALYDALTADSSAGAPSARAAGAPRR